MITFPNAKINLGLSVIGKRKDGMHEINTCIIPVPIYDIIEINRSESYNLKVTGPYADHIYNENLITKIWNVLIHRYPQIDPVQVCLFKNIPIGSGLGGGSSDAAFFLKLLNDFYKLNIEILEMEEICALIGSDCPLFIKNEPVIARGTGNKLSLINNPLTGYYLTIVYPEINISTKDAYSKVIPSGVELFGNKIPDHPIEWNSELKNDFEKYLFMDFPELEEIKSVLYKSGAIFSSMSGSGSSIFAVSKSPLNFVSSFTGYRVFQFLIN